jgi:spoIIIJ-associated protein
MRAVETEGKTVDEAVETALRVLKTTREETTIEVLQEPKTLLGMLTKPAKVRVSLGKIEPAPAPPAPAPSAKLVAAPVAPPVDDAEDDDVEVAEDREPAPRPTPTRPSRSRDDLRFSRDRVSDRSDDDDDEDARGEERRNRPVLDPDFDPAATLETICRHIDENATVEPRSESDRLVLTVHSDGSGVFIGRHGETLDALQYLINRIASKQNPTIGRIVVDSENYRDRKADRLADEALSLADKVKKSGRPMATRPLSAFDRRIIHTTLRDDDLVTTHSLGEGERKRVQIHLKDETPRPHGHRQRL